MPEPMSPARTEPETDDTTPRLVIQRRADYCVNPWVIIDSQSGEDLSFRVALDHPDLGRMPTSQRGFPTKQAAIDALGEIAWRAWDAHRHAGEVPHAR